MSSENFPEFEEPDDHPDERWLVSYADMMTLLFGLFVLLFSMASMDKETADRIRESTEKQFGSSERDPAAQEPIQTDAPMVPLSQLEELKNVIRDQINKISDLSEQLQNEQEKIAALIEENQRLSEQPTVRIPLPKDDSKELRTHLRKSQSRIAELESEIDLLRREDTESELREQIRSLESQLSGRSSDKERFESLRKQISKFRTQHERHKNQLRQLSAKNQSLQSEMKSFSNQSTEKDQTIQNLQNQLDLANRKRDELINKTKEFASKKKTQSEELSNQVKKLERELASTSSLEDQLKNLQNLASENEQKSKALEEKNQSLARQNNELLEQLKREAEKNRGNQSKQAFLAFIISWSSRDHDIDLTIEDPNGKKFDFKNRRFNGTPGHFALDTRRGPGVELWQSDNLTPGRYKANYFFYNQYGNVAPASVVGTIFSSKGSVELKPVELDLTKQRKYEVLFDVSKDGQVTVVSK